MAAPTNPSSVKKTSGARTKAGATPNIEAMSADAAIPPRPSSIRAKPAGAGTDANAANTASSIKTGEPSMRERVTRGASDQIGKLRDDAARLTDQAAVRAKDIARDGRDKTATGLNSFAKYIEDTAAGFDERLGKQYGDYARTAAASVASLASTVERQDIDELIDDTREFVRKSPAVAMGIAALAGFVLARMVRGGSGSSES